MSLTGGFLAGLGSGITEAVLIVTPFEVLKIRLQQQKGLDKAQLKYHGPVHAARVIVAEEGVTVSFSFFFSFLFLSFPFFSCFLL